MSQQKRKFLDGIATRIRGLLQDLDRLVNPPQPKPVRVPVRIPVHPPQPRRNPYR